MSIDVSGSCGGSMERRQPPPCSPGLCSRRTRLCCYTYDSKSAVVAVLLIPLPTDTKQTPGTVPCDLGLNPGTDRGPQGEQRCRDIFLGDGTSPILCMFESGFLFLFPEYFGVTWCGPSSKPSRRSDLTGCGAHTKDEGLDMGYGNLMRTTRRA